LVEELMLLANMAVAKHIYNHYPETSLLRRHPKPKAKTIRDLSEKCEDLNCPVEFTSGKSIANSLNEYFNDEKARLVVYPALVQFVLRSMQLAVYFSSGMHDDFHHYALNVPL
jgi:exoribonuclease R